MLCRVNSVYVPCVRRLAQSVHAALAVALLENILGKGLRWRQVALRHNARAYAPRIRVLHKGQSATFRKVLVCREVLPQL